MRFGNYGPDYVFGVITDHVGLAVGEGAREHTTASGRRVLILPDGTSVPVLCGEIAWIYTEDGRIDGRCGRPVYNDDLACPGHDFGIRHWRDASEAERADIERREDAEGVLQ